MKISNTFIKDLKIIELEYFQDNRGWFVESYSKEKFKQLEIDINFIQDNHSYSAFAGTLRGIHLQNAPHAQTKLVRCVRGKIIDVAVDLRKNSPTFKKWFSIELSDQNHKMLLIPQGFGHAFITLVPDVEVQYKVDSVYNKDSDRSINYLDPELNISWPNIEMILSDKDKNAKFLSEVDVVF